MDREKALDAATVFLGGYAKRWMESNYDRLMATETGRAAQSLDKRIRYVLEAGLYGLLVVMDRQLPDSSPVERLVKEIALDAPSEISKRLINGAVHAVAAARDQGQDSHLRNLLGLDEPAITEFLTYFGTLDSRERESVLHLIRDLEPGELSSFLALAPPVRNQFLGALRTARQATDQEKPSSPSILHGLRVALEKKHESRQREPLK